MAVLVIEWCGVVQWRWWLSGVVRCGVAAVWCGVVWCCSVCVRVCVCAYVRASACVSVLTCVCVCIGDAEIPTTIAGGLRETY